jgi:hypothetical protein
MFMLVARRYERASLIVTSNKPFSAWGEIFGDEVTATAMIDRLVRSPTARSPRAAERLYAPRSSSEQPHRTPAGASRAVCAATAHPPGAPPQRTPRPQQASVFDRRQGSVFQPALTIGKTPPSRPATPEPHRPRAAMPTPFRRIAARDTITCNALFEGARWRPRCRGNVVA